MNSTVKSVLITAAVALVAIALYQKVLVARFGAPNLLG